jgi:hypothetical protein
VRRAESWTIADILDFEYLLASDRSDDDAALRTRERAIYEKDIAPQLDTASRHDRRLIFRRWLRARRAERGDPLPGAQLRSGWQALLTFASLAGLGLGISLTAGLLHYRGDEPVNVAWFFAATVGIQWLLLAGAFGWWVLRKGTGILEDFRPMQALLSALLWAFSAGLRRLEGERRERLRAALATIGHHREIYGSLATWPFLVATQLFGVLFNIGVLGTLLLQVALSDVAFGWQSTLRTSPEEAYRLVAAISTPWSALPNPHPSFDQIVASRFAYSAGIQPLSQTAMTSWWPFLSYAVGTYGLLVRLLLLAIALAGLRRALRRVTFDHHGCNALFRRLIGPVFQSQPDAPALSIPPFAEAARPRVAGQCLVLLAEELTLDQDALAKYVGAQFGWQPSQVIAVQIDHPSGNAAALEQVAAAAANLAGIVVGIPARRAPIKAIALFLQKVVAAGSGAETLVLLFGPRKSSGFAPVTDAEFSHWQNFNAIHHLHLGFEKWRTE